MTSKINTNVMTVSLCTAFAERISASIFAPVLPVPDASVCDIVWLF